MKRLLLLIAALCLAVPALALPPQCSCPYCFQHSGSSCTLVPGNTVISCGSYIPTHCTMCNTAVDESPCGRDARAPRPHHAYGSRAFPDTL